MEILTKRWYLLAIACVINLCTGSIYAWSVFAGPKAAQLSQLLGHVVTAGDLSLAFSLANGLVPIPMVLGGFINDRAGPRVQIVLGGLLVAIGLWWAGTSESLFTLCISYGLIFCTGVGLTYSATVNNSIKFFPDHPGLAGGLATAAYGFCSVGVPPVAHLLIDAFGITEAFQILGVAFGIVIVVGGLLSQKCPKGFTVATENAAKGKVSGRQLNWTQMVRTTDFWLMLTLLLCGAITGMMIFSQTVGIATNQIGLSVSLATSAVAFLSLINTFGRLAAGAISDKLGQPLSLFFACLLTICGLLLLANCGKGSNFVFFTALVIIGSPFGAFLGIFPGYTAAAFGTKFNGANYGIMFCGFALSGAIGPWLMNALAHKGDFFYSYISSICLAALGAVLAWVLKLRSAR